MTGALVGDGFVRARIAPRNRYHTKQHPFFERWVAGGLTKLQMGRYMAQHSQLVREILRPFGVAYAKAPRELANP
jgi:pyrroloquinoline quinone (PQQ) biosynthesis protein C